MGFNDYERVQDTLMYLGSSFVLKFNVALANKDRFGNRKFFYKEYNYSSKYSDYGNIVSVKRNIRYFLSIEEVNNFDNGIIIAQSDMPMLRGAVTESARWLQTEDVFGMNKGNQLTILQDVSCQIMVGNNSALRFEPVVLPMQDGTSQRGIRMYINDMKNYVDMELRNFMGFYELIRSIDMYTAACAVIASLPMTHDDASVNRVDFESEAKEQRDWKSNRKPGFFDK